MNWGFSVKGMILGVLNPVTGIAKLLIISNRIQLLTFRCDGEEPGPGGCR